MLLSIAVELVTSAPSKLWTSLQAVDEAFLVSRVLPAAPFFVKASIYALLFALFVFVLEQLRFALKRSWLPGPSYVYPLLGGLLEMVWDPFTFWDRQRQYAVKASKGMSWNSMLGKFMIFSANTDVTRKVLSNNGPDSFEMVLHPNGRIILGNTNIAFMHGPEHLALRKSFLELFTRKALGVYLEIQEKAIHKHISMWLKAEHTAEMRTRVRDLNVETSQSVFVGPYLDEPQKFSEYYLLMTEGFLCLPIYFPGTSLYKAVQARHKVIDILAVACARSKEYLQKGGEPRCLLDFWAQRVLQDMKEAEEKKLPPPAYSPNHKMAETCMDFLFASQDASTASLTWICAMTATHPDILAKVRTEQATVRANNEPLSYELLEKMTYTRAVVLELLRYRPPAPMVPQLAMNDMKLTADFTCPKGSVVIPSLWSACMEGFPDPEKFDPERMMPERQEDIKFGKHFLPFGVGPHKCVGYNYAIQHLIAFLAVLSTSCQWSPVKVETDRVAYLPTIYPEQCVIRLEGRQ